METSIEIIGHRVGYRDFLGVDHFGFVIDARQHRSEPDVYYLAIVHEEGDLPNDKVYSFDPFTHPRRGSVMIGEYLRSDLCVLADDPNKKAPDVVSLVDAVSAQVPPQAVPLVNAINDQLQNPFGGAQPL